MEEEEVHMGDPFSSVYTAVNKDTIHPSKGIFHRFHSGLGKQMYLLITYAFFYQSMRTRYSSCCILALAARNNGT